MSSYFSQFFTGISLGAVLLLIAMGLTFTFGQMNVINMAHGELIMAGAYTVFMLQGPLGETGSLLIALPVAFVTAGAIGLVLEIVLIRRLYGRPLDTLLVTWGISLMLQQLARDLFGAPNVQVNAPDWLRGGVEVFGTVVAKSRLFTISLAIACLAMIWFFLNRLAQGRRMRAVMQNRPLAESAGVSTRATDRLTFFIGSGLAGVAGVALTLMGSISPNLGTAYVINAFLVVVIGGVGQIKGTVIAAFVLGVVQSWVEFTTTASSAQVIVFALIVAFLQVRPQGIYQVRTRSLA